MEGRRRERDEGGWREGGERGMRGREGRRRERGMRGEGGKEERERDEGEGGKEKREG